jgi:hypothetical protein
LPPPDEEPLEEDDELVEPPDEEVEPPEEDDEPPDEDDEPPLLLEDDDDDVSPQNAFFERLHATSLPAQTPSTHAPERYELPSPHEQHEGAQSA